MEDLLKKYKYTVFYYDEDECFVGTCSEFPSLSGFGDTKAEAIQEIENVVRYAVEILEEEGKEPPVPYSERDYKGRILLRINPETHREVAEEAQKSQMSINQYLSSIIDSRVGSRISESTILKLIEEVEIFGKEVSVLLSSIPIRQDRKLDDQTDDQVNVSMFPSYPNMDDNQPNTTIA